MIENNVVKNEFNFNTDIINWIERKFKNFKFVCTEAEWQPLKPQGSVVRIEGKITNITDNPLQVANCLLNGIDGHASRLIYTTQPELHRLGNLPPHQPVDVCMYFTLPSVLETSGIDRYGDANCKLIIKDSLNKQKSFPILCKSLINYVH